MEPISLNVRLYGTQEPPAASRTLRPAPERRTRGRQPAPHPPWRHRNPEGHLLHRARPRLGTYAPRILGLSVREHAEHFDVSYEACVDDCVQRLSYSVSITGTPLGLRFSSRARAETDFETNRAGFVILHRSTAWPAVPRRSPTDGRVARVRFPELIAPTQPMSQARHRARACRRPARAHCLMEGDTLGNGGSAQLDRRLVQTYAPAGAALALHAAPEHRAGAANHTCRCASPVRDARTAAPTLRLDLGASAGALPAVGVGLCRAELATASAHMAEPTPLRPRHLIYHFDPPRADPEADLRQAANIAHGLSAEPWLEAVVASVTGFEQELAELGRIHARIGSPFRVVLASPARRPQGWPCRAAPGPPRRHCPHFTELRARPLPGVRLAAACSVFTELNRKRPPLDEIDLLTFTTSAIVHAGRRCHGDREPSTARPLCASVRSIAGGKLLCRRPQRHRHAHEPLWRYAAARTNTRQPMNENDPRQRGLMGAAWALSHVCHMARGGAQAVTLGGVTGARVIAAAAFGRSRTSIAGGYFPHLPCPARAGRPGGMRTAGDQRHCPPRSMR